MRFVPQHTLSRWSDENGSDTPQNAVALCANCHCKLHYAKNKEEMRKKLIECIDRLQEE
jgi:5-methylcytosine-specific restriction protein A